MTFFCLTQNIEPYRKVKELLERNFNCKRAIEISFSRQKPALAGTYAGVYDFSISHSGAIAAIAVSDKKIGCDIELLKGKDRTAVINRFTGREKATIKSERDFVENWTAKEAYIKLNALALATHLKRLEYFEGRIYLDGEGTDCPVVHLPFKGGMACVCGDSDIKIADV